MTNQTNPLLKLQAFGQSIWLDYLRRRLIISGELQQLIEEDGLRGMTSNPSIFEKAIGGSKDYDEDIRALALEGKSIQEIYQELTVQDIQSATDRFRPMYDSSGGRHGFVSLEVSPHLAHDTQGTIEEARRLWSAVNRPNVMIKVPATLEGLPAIQQLTGEGINVNITLLFGLPRYRRVAEAYMAGLEERVGQGRPVDQLSSVASFFLSRIDVLVDPLLEKVMDSNEVGADLARKLHGQVAIASARVAYQMYKEIFSSARFQDLMAHGARSQRLLWASTSTKNPHYSDVKYVEALIGPETVSTMPMETLNAYRDHGNPATRLEEGLAQAEEVLERLIELGIDINQVTQQLEDEGVEKFNKPYDRLMKTLEKKHEQTLKEPLDRQRLHLNGYQDRVEDQLERMKQENFTTRLWRKDPNLWKSDAKDRMVITKALGWLHLPEKMEDHLKRLKEFAEDIRRAGFRHVVHMGMGGSSLAPLVFQQTFPPSQEGLPLTVLDTTDPITLAELEKQLPLADTLFIAASKSGTTAETRAFTEYFYNRIREFKGDQAGRNFIAITDPGTPLAELARERGFRGTFFNFPDIGGRYSALSYFGLVPAALLGVDVEELLERALRMMHASDSCVPVEENPGVALGTTLGILANQGRDKVTFLVDEPVATLGMWLEQLLAESTGKEGKGIVPVAGEPAGSPSEYGEDRAFVYLTMKENPNPELERRVDQLKRAGQPVVSIQVDDRLDLGQEFYRWEIATATAGAVMGINPFDQPNVQESKDNTNRLLEEVDREGQLPEREAVLAEPPLKLYAQKAGENIRETLAEFLKGAQPGDYVDVMAYLPESEATAQALQDLRQMIRDRLGLATTVGYGPRYLHSTGQLHKGGPNKGLFLQITAEEGTDVPVPEHLYTFSVFKRAQALGDLEALRRHGRRVVQIDLGKDIPAGLAALKEAIREAL